MGQKRLADYQDRELRRHHQNKTQVIRKSKPPYQEILILITLNFACNIIGPTEYHVCNNDHLEEPI